MSYAFFREKDFVDTQRGKYPKGWKLSRFGSIITLEYGKGLPEVRRKQGLYPVFGSNGVVGYHDRGLVRGPGIIVGRKGTIGAVALSKSDFWPIDTTYYVKMRTGEIDLNWLFYELVHLNLPRLSSADVVPGLKRELVNNLILPIPSLAEQQKIAATLALVDSAIELADRVIAKTERLKKGLMQQLLTRGIGHIEYKDTPIGKIPKTWQITDLTNVFKLASGKPRPSEICERASSSAKYPVYGGNGVLGYSGDFLLDRETIVIGRVGEYCGCVYKTEARAWITDNALYATEVSKDFDLMFLKYLLSYMNLNKFKKKMGQPLITQTILYGIDIPHPPLPEQHKIVDILLTVDKKLELERKEKSRLDRTKQGLMDLLLTGKVRIKVD